MHPNQEQEKYGMQANRINPTVGNMVDQSKQDIMYQNNFNGGNNPNDMNYYRNNQLQQQNYIENNNNMYAGNNINMAKNQMMNQQQVMPPQGQYIQDPNAQVIHQQQYDDQNYYMNGVNTQQNQQHQFMNAQGDMQNHQILKQGNDFQQIQFMMGGGEGVQVDHQYTMYNQLQNHQFDQNYGMSNDLKPANVNSQYPQIGNPNYQSAQFYQKQQHLNTLQEQNQKQNNQDVKLKQQPNSDIEDPYFNSIFIFQNRFDVPKRYQLLVPIGIGGYGVVAKAFDQEKQDFVAIKKIFKPFLNPLETKRILREIKILKALEHDNIISIRDVLSPVPKEKLEDIYIISQLMDTDLHQIIASDQILSEDHIQFFIYQLLCGLKYIHSAGVFHRDLKPGNLLVNSDCVLKICDFGLARTVDTKVNVLVLMTEYVATRWYRAPELLLSWNKYTTAIDMWAVGCIFSELYMRKPLLPGESYLNQLILTLNLTGTPSKEDLENIQSDRAKQFIISLGNKAPKDLSKLIPNASPQAIDLISKMIVFNPDKRISAEEALKHPFFESIREQDFEVEAKVKFDFDFEREDITLDELKDAIYQEMLKFHPTFDENNKETYHVPLKRDSDLFTLDYDGSKIYIDYKLGQNDQPQQVVQNIQQINEKMVKDIIGVDGNGKMIQDQQFIQMPYYNNTIFSPSQVEQQNYQHYQQQQQQLYQQNYNVQQQQHQTDTQNIEYQQQQQQQQQQPHLQHQAVFNHEGGNQYMDIQQQQQQQQFMMNQHYVDYNNNNNQVFINQQQEIDQNDTQMREE
ncbi:hypothetical protein ABPG74_015792 [Tetrahymena malaccensis]